MAGEWRATTLGEVIELKRGYDLASTQRTPGPIPIVSSSGPSGAHTEAMVRGPGVVTGRYGTIGQVFYVPSDFWPLNTTLYVRDFKGANPRFVAYFLKTLDFQAYTDKAAVPGINRNDVHRAEVLWPPVAVQEQIAHLLGSLDDKIELNRRMAATLEEMARALFKSWFVDFDPVRAKAEGRDTGLPAATAALFPDRFGEDGLPTGWSTGTLADVSLLNPESRGSVSEGEIVYVDLANTKWGVIEATQHFASDDAPSRAQRILRSGDTIVGTVRPGNGSYALAPSNNLIGSTGFAVLRPKTPSFREFVYLAATSGENIEALAALADGGAYPAVRPDVVANTPCCLLPAKVLEAFQAVTVDLMDRIEAARSQSATLGAIRDTLLPKLISGELRIKDANGAVEAA